MVFGDDKLITVKNKIIVKFIMLSMTITSIWNTQLSVVLIRKGMKKCLKMRL